MTTDTAILDALRTLIGDAAYEAAARMNAQRRYDPRDDMDEDSLRRSRIAAVRSDTYYRRAADMPREQWRDDVAVAVGDWIPERSA